MTNLAGQTIKIKEDATHRQVPDFGGSEITIEGLWKDVHGKSWYMCEGIPACIIYAMRRLDNNLPHDDNVYYGKIGSFGHLVHESELII